MTHPEETYRIVVAVGFTPECVHAVRHALGLASRMPGAELHLTTVLDRVQLARKSEAAHADLVDTELRLVSFTREAAHGMPQRPAPLNTVFHVRVGAIAPTIVQVAFDVDATFIVVGSRAPNHAKRMLVGKVADALIREGRYPVLLARETNVEGMSRTARPDPRRPGQDLEGRREETLQSAERMDFHGTRVHASGLR